jgi:hypothetical protein
MATIYVEDDQYISPYSKVEIFGNYSKNLWQTKTVCHYDSFWKCFKADIKISTGSQFKFILDDG